VKKNSTKQWGVFFLLVCAIPFILRRPLGDAVFWHLGAGRSLLYHSFGPGLWADWMMPAYFYCTWASDLVLEIISMIVGIRHLWCLVPILVVSLTTWLFGQTKSVFCSVLFICLTFPFYEVGPTLFAVAYSTFFCVCLSLQQPERRIGNLLLIVALWANFHPSFIAGCLSLILLWVYPQSATKKTKLAFNIPALGCFSTVAYFALLLALVDDSAGFDHPAQCLDIYHSANFKLKSNLFIRSRSGMLYLCDFVRDFPANRECPYALEI